MAYKFSIPTSKWIYFVNIINQFNTKSRAIWNLDIAILDLEWGFHFLIQTAVSKII